MGIIKTKGLEGLKGLSDLNNQDRTKFLESIDDKLEGSLTSSERLYVASIIYDNQKYIEIFGEDAFEKSGESEEAYIRRNKEVEAKLVSDLAREKYSTDDRFIDMSQGLDIQGWKDLLESDYIGSVERKKRLYENIKEYNEKADDLDIVYFNSEQASPAAAFVPATARASIAMTQVQMRNTPEEIDKDYAEHDNKILEKIQSEVRERRENEVESLTDDIYNSFFDAESEGTKSIADSYKEADKLLDTINYYKAFKNSDDLEDYTEDERLKDYSKYLALKQSYGEGIAQSYLERTIQNRVADAQDGKPTFNTIKKIGTTIYSDLGSNIPLVLNMINGNFFNPARMALVYQGIDPDTGKPLEDWVSPKYWNDVYKYNAFSSDYHRIVEAQGGISEDINVRHYGHIPDPISWETVQEGTAQLGHIAAFAVESYLLGGVGKAAGFGLKAGLKGVGAGVKLSADLSRVGNITNDIFVAAGSGASMAQLEAMGVFEEAMLAGDEEIQNQIKAELNEYINNVDLNSSEARSRIDKYYQHLKNEDNKRVARSKEGHVQLPLDDKTLKEQAAALYMQDLMQAEYNRLEDVHKKDNKAKAEAAAKGAASTFILSLAKNGPMDLLVQKFKFAKGSTRGAFDNYLSNNIISDFKGGVKAKKKLASAKALANEGVKQILGGFVDEYSDGLIAAFGTGVANKNFDDYINKTYNPEIYNATVDCFIGNMLAGASASVDWNTLSDYNNLYEGFIGAISPVSTVGVNHNAVFHPKDTWGALIHGVDEDGNKLNVKERISSIVMNPLLNTYAELKAKDRNIQKQVGLINKVVADNRENVEQASKIIGALHDFNSPLVKYSYSFNNPNSEDSEGATPTILDSKDRKLQSAFTLINALNTLKTLENIEGGSESTLYKRTMKTIQGLASGATTSVEQVEAVKDEMAKSWRTQYLREAGKYSAKLGEKAEKYSAKLGEKAGKYSAKLGEKAGKYSAKLGEKAGRLEQENFEKRQEEYQEWLDTQFTDTDLSAEIFAFLAAPNNRSIRENPNATEIAKERLQKNSQYLLDMMNKMNEVNEMFTKNPKLANMDSKVKQYLSYTIVSKQDYKERLDNILSDLEFGNIQNEYTPDYNARLGTKKSANNAFYAINREAFKLKKKINKIKKEIDDNAVEVNKGKQALKKSSKLPEKEKQRIEHDIALQNARELKYNTLNEQYDALVTSEEAIRHSSVNNTETVFTEDYLLGLDIRDLAYILNPKNTKNYSKKQQKVIDKVRRKINNKYTDAGLQKLYDAAILADRLNDIEVVYDKISNNSELASSYISSIEYVRDREAISIGLQEEINSRYSKIEKAWNNRYGKKPRQIEKREEEFKNAIIESSPELLEAYMEDHPEHEEQVRPYYELSKFIANAAVLISRNMLSKIPMSNTQQVALLDTINDIQNRVKSKEEAVEEIQKIINSDVDAVTKNLLKALLTNMGELTMQQDATVSNKVDTQDKKEENKSKKSLGGEITGIGDDADITSIENEQKVDLEDGTNTEKEEKDVKYVKTKEEDKDKNVSFAKNNKEKSSVENSDYIITETPSVEDQALGDEDKNVEVSSDFRSNDAEDAVAKQHSEANKNSLSGTGMGEYELGPLLNEKKLKHKKGVAPNDSMNRFYSWLHKQGIKQQQIVDTELGLILKHSPHAKVKFMHVLNESDTAIKDKVFLVLDYDDNINKNITRIHNTNNGGVIESNGKKYLLIGVIGYPNKDKQAQALKDIISNVDPKADVPYGLAKKGMEEFSRNHPEEKFYVSEEYSTEIIPDSLLSGQIVKRLESDATEEYRDITEVLYDADGNINYDRNPLGFTLDTLAWGIQELTKFATVNASSDETLVPKNTVSNSGRAFVLIPTSNNKYVPAYLKPCFWSEVKKGSALQGEILDSINKLTSPKYSDRVAAIETLQRIFYFNSEIGDQILVGKDGGPHANKISFTKGGKVVKTFDLNNYNSQEFFNYFYTFNPRVNITTSVLRSEPSLKKYNEAGVLKTDVALLQTVGSTFRIYALDEEGVMQVPQEPVENRKTRDTQFKNPTHTQVIYHSDFYNYNIETGEYTLNGTPVTDTKTIEALEYNRKINDSLLTSIRRDSKSDGMWGTYIISENPVPEVIEVNENTKDVKILLKEEAERVIEEYKEQKAKKARGEAAEEELDRTSSWEGIDEDNLILETEEVIEDLNSTDILEPVVEDDLNKNGKKEEENTTLPKTETLSGIEKVSEKKKEGTKVTRTYKDLMSNSTDRKVVRDAIKEKFPNRPTNTNELMGFLRSKGIEVDAINVSTEAWIQTLKECK